MGQTCMGRGNRQAHHGAEDGSHNAVLVQCGYDTDEMLNVGSDTSSCISWIEEDGNYRSRHHDPNRS
jgi:hypothetical protein